MNIAVSMFGEILTHPILVFRFSLNWIKGRQKIFPGSPLVAEKSIGFLMCVLWWLFPLQHSTPPTERWRVTRSNTILPWTFATTSYFDVKTSVPGFLPIIPRPQHLVQRVSGAVFRERLKALKLWSESYLFGWAQTLILKDENIEKKQKWPSLWVSGTMSPCPCNAYSYGMILVNLVFCPI